MVTRYANNFIEFTRNKIRTIQKSLSEIKDQIDQNNLDNNVEKVKELLELYKKKEKRLNYLIKISLCNQYGNKKDLRKIFSFIFKEFISELRDEFIKANINPLTLPFFGELVICSKKPEGKITENGKFTFPIDWKKSLKRREELIKEGVAVQQKDQKGEKWLMAKTEPYPILNWVKSKFIPKNNVMTVKEWMKLKSNILFKVNQRFFGDIYKYYRLKPEMIEKYKITGNGWYNKIKDKCNTRKTI